jgi:hypothetical protein
MGKWGNGEMGRQMAAGGRAMLQSQAKNKAKAMLAV